MHKVKFRNMVIWFWVPTLLLSLSGCGYNPDDPVYDTASNPDKYPRAALDIIDMVESNERLNVENVITSFVDLYSAHQELLDDHDWREIISRIGLKLRVRAEEISGKGVEYLDTAADYYQLAAFARPDDPKIKHQAELFGSWEAESTAVLVELGAANNQKVTASSLRATIEAYKNFAYTDSTHYEFASKVLFNPLLGNPFRDQEVSSIVLDSLSLGDRALLDCYELTAVDFDSVLCSFESPNLDLMYLDLIDLGNHRYRAELYWRPGSRPEKDFSIAFWVDAFDRAEADSVKARSLYLPFDFAPLPSTSTWLPGHLQLSVRTFECSGNIQKLSLGLYLKEDKQVRYLPIRGIDGNLVRLSVAARRPGNTEERL